VGAAAPVVRVVGAEATAALAGALSTPGAHADVVVLDLGAGTIDAVAYAGEAASGAGAGTATATATVAGGGALVTLAVAELLQVPLGAAEWAKRGPCERVENPLLVLGEDGSRRFVERALPAATVGSLVAPGPAGPLPFTRTLSPAEWRGLRLRVKRELLGASVSVFDLLASLTLADQQDWTDRDLQSEFGPINPVLFAQSEFTRIDRSA